MKAILTPLILCGLVSSAATQPFENLDFDSYDPATRFLLGWQVLVRNIFRTNMVDHLPLNWDPLTFGFASMYGEGGGVPYEGKFSLGIVPEPGLFRGDFRPMEVFQTAEIPPEARFIQFFNFGNPFELRVNGEPISLTYQLRDGPAPFGFYRWADAWGDVSAFASQHVEVRFVTLEEFDVGRSSAWNGLDSIRFVVPEPSTWLLLGLGGAGLLAWHHRQRRRSSSGK
jgi:hypothetical protein